MKTLLPLEIEKILSKIVQHTHEYNKNNNGYSHSESNPYSQTVHGKLCIVRPKKDYSIKFEYLLYGYIRNQIRDEKALDLTRTTLSNALLALLNNLFSRHSNHLETVKNILINSYTSAKTNYPLYSEFDTFQLIRETVNSSINENVSTTMLFCVLLIQFEQNEGIDLEQMSNHYYLHLDSYTGLSSC